MWIGMATMLSLSMLTLPSVTIFHPSAGRGVDRKFVAVADNHEFLGDGADATRIVLRVTDEFDRIRPIANDPMSSNLAAQARSSATTRSRSPEERERSGFERPNSPELSVYAQNIRDSVRSRSKLRLPLRLRRTCKGTSAVSQTGLPL